MKSEHSSQEIHGNVSINLHYGTVSPEVLFFSDEENFKEESSLLGCGTV
jgi:hypothetical protein